MTVLLDVNVLLALVDADHLDHERAHEWAADGLAAEWATCALTQNGVVRILSQPKYPNPLSVPDAFEVLRQMVADPRHEYWTCDVQLADGAVRADRFLGSRQVTDVYSWRWPSPGAGPSSPSTAGSSRTWWPVLARTT